MSKGEVIFILLWFFVGCPLLAWADIKFLNWCLHGNGGGK